MLNGNTFNKFFNHAEFSTVVSDIWECGPQNELIDFETNFVWDNFVEKCKRYLMPEEQFKNKRFYIKCNSHSDYKVFLHKQGVLFDQIPVEYFLFDTYRTCGVASPKNLMDWREALDDVEMSTEEKMELVWTDDKIYDAIWLNRVPKGHRISSLVEANKRGLLDNMVWSCGYEEDTPPPPDNDEKTEEFVKQLPKMAENEPRENQQDGPIRAKHDRKFNFQWLLDCKVNIVSESQARDIIIEMDPAQPVRFLTEKTFKPMAYGMPFMIFGNRNSLKRVRELGFKTFPEWFDESYDEEENFTLRLNAMLDSYEKFLSEEHSIEEIRDALEHNFNRISDRFWIMSRIVDPIRIIWDEIEIKRSTRES